MKTLEQLALEEEQLALAVSRVRGSIQEKAQQLTRGGEVERYREVHRQYVELARAGDVEALRRATFLQWLSTIEPTAFTALGVLDQSASHALVALLDEMCKGSNVDAELGWMLPYYKVVAKWWFEADRAPALAEFCAKNAPRLAPVPPEDFACEGRGLLGAYWASRCRSSTRKPG